MCRYYARHASKIPFLCLVWFLFHPSTDLVPSRRATANQISKTIICKPSPFSNSKYPSLSTSSISASSPRAAGHLQSLLPPLHVLFSLQIPVLRFIASKLPSQSASRSSRSLPCSLLLRLAPSEAGIQSAALCARETPARRPVRHGAARSLASPGGFDDRAICDGTDSASFGLTH